MAFRKMGMSLFAIVTMMLWQQAEAATRRKKSIVFPSTGSQLNSFEPVKTEAERTVAEEAEPIASDQILSTGDKEEDLEHFHTISRKMGIDIGMMIPLGDFARDFTYAPMIGFHLSWEAIPPLHVMVEMRRSSSPQRDTPSNAKLSVNTISMGTMASLGAKRFSPFLKLMGSLNFSDVSFNDGRRITSGNDFNLTTVGLNAGLGVDFVVGREVSVGLDLTYYYAVPKKLTLVDASNNASNFDLGSPYAIIGLRINF